MEILCFYVNSAFGKEGLPNVLARFAPFKHFTHIFIAKLATFVRVSLLNLSNAQIAVAATDVRSKRYHRDAPASVLVQFLEEKFSTTKCSTR